MLRVLLFIALVAAVAGLGFVAGRLTMTPPPERQKVESPQTATPDLPAGTATRGRRIEPPPSPPAVVPSVPDSGPPVPGGEPDVPVNALQGDGAALLARSLVVPIRGLKRSDLQDTFNQTRAAGERIHEALDIMAPRGTPVHAVDNGIVVKLFTSKPGGLTIYQFDPTERFCYYYAHLDRYADGLRDGMLVKRGDIIGYVGSTGNADQAAPHLHFAVFELGPEKKWWEGKPINPYPLLIRALE